MFYYFVVYLFVSMMKDLKHYFASPIVNGGVRESNIIPASNQSVIEDTVEKVSNNKSTKNSGKKKKMKRKRLLSDSEISLNELSDDFDESFTTKNRKKPKKSTKTPIIASAAELHADSSTNDTPTVKKRTKNSSIQNKKNRESSSSKENSQSLSDVEDKPSPSSENSKNLFSYFNKVDKFPDFEEKPRKIKVDVLVHADISGSPPSESNGKKASLKKRRSSRKKSVVDFDLITSEEIPDVPKIEDKANDCRNGITLPGVAPDSTSKCQTPGKEIVDENELSVISDDPKSNSTNDHGKSSEEKKKDSSEINEDVVYIGTEIRDNKNEHQITGDDPVAKPITNVRESTGSNEDVEIVSIEPPQIKSKAKHDGTLASFFNLGSRGSTTPTVEKKIPTLAKQQFLLSSAPPSVKLPSASSSSCQGCPAPFPTRSHLQQKERMNILWNLSKIKLPLKPSVEALVSPSPLPWESLVEKEILAQSKSDSSQKKAKLKELKNELNLFPISCWYKELKKMKKKRDEHWMWTERYRPRCSSGFLANTRSISRLKAWLTELKETSVTDSGGSSGDEFVKEGDETEGARTAKKTVLLLSGPPGTGKTAAVYAIAEEIGYNVLELNASSNRSGKRILNEFSEALQSHKVGVSKLNFSKTKKKKIEEPNRNLILIEDADLLFEDDEGFVPTLLNLSAGTKRPIILVANNPGAKHLGKLAHLLHASLPFGPPTQDRLGSWLRTLAVVEGFNLSTEDSVKLASSLDLRKCLLQLQSSYLSSASSVFEKGDSKEVEMWHSISNLDLTDREGRKKALSVMSCLTGLDLIRQNKKCRGFVSYWEKGLEDSTLSRECLAEPPASRDTFQEIETSLLGLASTVSSQSPAAARLPLLSVPQLPVPPRELLEVERDVCSLTSLLNRRSLGLDYWPALRQVSRTEGARLLTHTKRNNRYFNYLSSLGVKGPPDLFQSLGTPFS